MSVSGPHRRSSRQETRSIADGLSQLRGSSPDCDKFDYSIERSEDRISNITFFAELCDIFQHHWMTMVAVSTFSAMFIYIAILYETTSRSGMSISSAIGFQWTSADVKDIQQRTVQIESSNSTRPDMSADTLLHIHDVLIHASTRVQLGWVQGGVLIVQALEPTTNIEQHRPIPNAFHEGIHYGLSAWNPWEKSRSQLENEERTESLRHALSTMADPPQKIYTCMWSWEEYTWQGLVAEFASNNLGNSTHEPLHLHDGSVWTTVRNSVLKIARSFQQFAVYEWYPSIWGQFNSSDSMYHLSVIQEVVPTRTGLQSIRSKSVVYRV